MVAMFATSMVACSDDDDSTTTGGGSGSDVLAGTVWQLHNEEDPTYHMEIYYTVTFSSPTGCSYIVASGDAHRLTNMAGTYDFSNGRGTAYLKYQDRPEDQNEYRMTFMYDGGQTLTWHVNSRDIVLSKLETDNQ